MKLMKEYNGICSFVLDNSMRFHYVCVCGAEMNMTE